MTTHYQFVSIKISILGANEVAWWVKALATKADDPSSISGTYGVEAENQFLQVVSGFHKHLMS